jgi:hypothetical protein
MRSAWLILAACLAISSLTGTVYAQRSKPSLAPDRAEMAAAASLRMPSPALLRTGPLLPSPAVARPSRRQGEVLMIVGGAVLLAGLLVDEGIISIAGAAIGGYGLYVYLSADRRR